MNHLTFRNQSPIDFIALGRLCIDLNANEINRPMEETITFTKYVGGSPANIAIGMSRLGKKTGFIGRVADDQMGSFILNYLNKNQIDTSNVLIDQSGSKTGLAFTEIKSPVDCSILMYRDNVADLKLEPRDIKEDYIKSAKSLLISGTALAKSPSREAVFLAVEYARKHDVCVFFDIDYRPYTWNSVEETAIYYNLIAQKCDVIIGTREEFDMMECFDHNPNHDDEMTAEKWFSYYAKIVVIKHGKDGSIAYTSIGEKVKGRTFPAKVIKTFGAGDSYAAGFIYGLMEDWSLFESMDFGAAAASIVISSHSCSDAMPTVNQIKKYIQKCQNGEIITT
ncbi:5-dehydro-2-deoxygluconokinase [Gottfriedia acidiceleris]|uniref:5-dehydro-2-deoxygluconokinase n=1 Tax=Gottfriedia acidiceleris TaxID=371036 RepID=A0ABY4JR22_9BACI|nr:5-dehydro-2-deoxygluconokinase [Gottfriedia acidiceleris]UPM55540.1 5-dehydro-2-deoxygluconokinase [Gottfriedia acidiceleris]